MKQRDGDKPMTAQLTIGPILFHWPAEKKRDFYFRIADEAPVETVYLGEVICSKRTPFFEQHYSDVAERLMAGGKKVVFCSLAEIMIPRERKMTEGLCELEDSRLKPMMPPHFIICAAKRTGLANILMSITKT